MQILSVDEMGLGIKAIRPKSIMDMMKVLPAPSGFVSLLAVLLHSHYSVIACMSSIGKNKAFQACGVLAHVDSALDLFPDQAAAGMDEDEEFEEHGIMGERPGHTIGQSSVMQGMSRNLLHSNSISNTPNLNNRRSGSVRRLTQHLRHLLSACVACPHRRPHKPCKCCTSACTLALCRHGLTEGAVVDGDA